MRTPGHDEELALGFALSEGLRPLVGPRAGRSRRQHDRARGAGVRPRPPGAVVLHDVLLRRLRQGRARGDRGRGAAGREPLTIPPALVATLPDRLREAQAAFAATGGLHATGPLHAGRRARVRARGRRPPQRDGQGDRARLPRRSAAALRPRPLRQRPALVRARPEGGGRRLPDPRRGRGAVVARGRARRRPWRHAVRLRPRRPGERLLATRAHQRRGRRFSLSPGPSARLRDPCLGRRRSAPARGSARDRDRARRARSCASSPARRAGSRASRGGTSNACSQACAITLDHGPSRTWAISVEIEFVSTVGRGSAPASWKMPSTMRRFCMSPVSRQSGSVAASAQRHLVAASRTARPRGEQHVALVVERQRADAA